MRGATKPEFVEARKTWVMPLGTSPDTAVHNVLKDGGEEKSTLTPEAAKSEPEAVETKLEPKAKTKPEVEILRQAFKALRAPLPVFKKWAEEIHKLNVSGNLFREYLEEVV